ncbi:tetratricopeptide (TPR) repeat protein [Rhizomicrobium palustre]|uniref:Tetratricopeptide (TPR) repeat protein n=1 Tax=Rhizomicrobium palustre TaxID=189966 RepID=A0A846N2D5_9PROT|nr:tetratricopeptide repeat protein [Rhizomicrobium palustre]NIK90154.1 tetratricopeptide (TPR) repeat protein [Rhizomicrobium palustre]
MRIASLIVALGLSCLSLSVAEAKTTARIDTSDQGTAGLGRYLSARFAAGNHDFAEAAKLYRDSLTADSTNQQLLTFAFFYSAAAGHVDEAAKIAERLVTIAPDDRAARLTLAVNALHNRDYKKARVEIGKSAKGPFTSFSVALIDGWAAAGAGEKDAAYADFKLLHAQHSADALAYFNEAMLAELFGDRDAADSFYRQSLLASGPTPRVVDAFGRFLERSGQANAAKQLYEKTAINEGYATVTEPGLARIAKGVLPDPLAPRAEDGAAEALFGIAASLNDEQSRDISILYLRLALHLSPKLDLATILLANRFEAMGKYEDAIHVYAGVPQSSPFYRASQVAVAVDIARQDKFDEAIARLTSLAKADPNDLECWTALGDAYRESKRFGEAVAAYDRALAAAGPHTKKSWPLLYARAMAEHEAGNWDKAEADLKEALMLSPSEPQVLNFLGYSWVDKGENTKEALAMLEKARQLAPQDGYIIDSVGWAYYKLGRYAEAVDALEDAVQLVPGDPTINDHLGDAYWKTGRKLDATFQWSHALAFGAEAGDKAKIEKKLQTAQQ